MKLIKPGQVAFPKKIFHKHIQMSYWPVVNNISLHSFLQYSPTHSDAFQDYYGSESSDYSNDPLTSIHHCNLEVCNEGFREVVSISCCSSLSTESIFYSFQAWFSCQHFEPCPIPLWFRSLLGCGKFKFIGSHVSSFQNYSLTKAAKVSYDIWLSLKKDFCNLEQ